MRSGGMGMGDAMLMFGIGALPDGKRKDRLTGALDGVIELFADRVLPFDIDAARHYADLAVKARVAGKGFPTPDGYIAAIAASLPPGSIPLAGRELAGAFLSGYVLYSLCSPFSAINLIMSSLTKFNPLVVGLKQNALFGLAYMAVSIAIICLFIP